MIITIYVSGAILCVIAVVGVQLYDIVRYCLDLRQAILTGSDAPELWSIDEVEIGLCISLIIGWPITALMLLMAHIDGWIEDMGYSFSFTISSSLLRNMIIKHYKLLSLTHKDSSIRWIAERIFKKHSRE